MKAKSKKIWFEIDSGDFKYAFGRNPRSQKEFDKFVEQVDYLVNKDIDFETTFTYAAFKMKN